MFRREGLLPEGIGSTDIADMSKSKFFTDVQLEFLNIGYDGNNLTWKGYVRQIHRKLVRIFNATDLSKPSHPRNAPISRVIHIFEMINKLEKEHLVTTYHHFDDKLTQYLTTIESPVEKSENSKNSIKDENLLELHKCIWDVLKFSCHPTLFNRARLRDEEGDNILQSPQKCSLKTIYILKNIWIPTAFSTPCIDFPETYVWGKDSFNKEWFIFREKIEDSGFVESYPLKLNFLFITVAVATTKFENIEPIKEIFKGLKYTKNRKADWYRFCLEVDEAIYQYDDLFLPIGKTKDEITG